MYKVSVHHLFKVPLLPPCAALSELQYTTRVCTFNLNDVLSLNYIYYMHYHNINL